MALTNTNEDMQREPVIWQQNLNKSQTGQHDLISNGKLAYAKIDIVAIQELAMNFLDKMIATRDWIPIYPSTHVKELKKTRAMILMNCNLSTKNWEQIEFPSGDVTVVKISSNWGQISLFNIYNDCTHDRTIRELMYFHRSNQNSLLGSAAGEPMHNIIWVGDFNRHHPAWDNPEDTRLFT